jgi:hypothetical protein
MGSALTLTETDMTRKPMSWTMVPLIVGAMLVGTLCLDMAFSSSLRHQMLSIHSDLWQVGIPGNALGDAIIAIAMRAAFNWHLSKQRRTDLETRQSS